jgi:hypothetical protein
VPHFQQESKPSSNVSPQLGQIEVLLPGNAFANSGASAKRRHSVLPSTCNLVSDSIRPSAIHWRICFALTGPYSIWSAPMIR